MYTEEAHSSLADATYVFYRRIFFTLGGLSVNIYCTASPSWTFIMTRIRAIEMGTSPFKKDLIT